MARKKSSIPINPVLALVLAWLIPGAGHVYMGRTARGIIIFITLTALFWSGVAMGGVMTVSPKEERWWFVAEMFAGANGLIGWQRYRALVKEMESDPEVDLPTRAGAADNAARQARIDRKLAREGLALVAPTANVARAYAGVAGLLNLLCIFDAMMLAMIGKTGEPVRIAGKEEQEGRE